MTFSVYDRWGERVFETDDQAAGWNGTYKGNMNEGVFAYYFTATLVSGEQISRRGTISLLR